MVPNGLCRSGRHGIPLSPVSEIFVKRLTMEKQMWQHFASTATSVAIMYKYLNIISYIFHNPNLYLNLGIWVDRSWWTMLWSMRPNQVQIGQWDSSRCWANVAQWWHLYVLRMYQTKWSRISIIVSKILCAGWNVQKGTNRNWKLLSCLWKSEKWAASDWYNR